MSTMLMHPIVSAKVATLKARLRSLYIRHDEVLSNLSCGKQLAYHLDMGGSEKLRRQINATLDELSLLDPSCPKYRL